MQGSIKHEKSTNNFKGSIGHNLFIFRILQVYCPNFEPEGRVDLTAGQKTVAVFNLDCEHCQEAAKELGALSRNNKKFPKLYLLFYQEGSTTVSEFENLTQSSFPYAFIDVNMFFDLIGNAPPRIYHLKEGKVESVWDENFVLNFQEAFELK